MKKIIIFVTVFSIIAITTTGLLIKSKNNNSENNEEKSIDNINQTNKENTHDLYSAHDENDLKPLEKTEMFESPGKEIYISYIEDFKNKDVENKINDNQMIEEKTLDLYGTYDENDLRVFKKPEMVESLGKEIYIPYIEGLKNKDVENKVNNDMKNRVVDAVNEYIIEHKDEVSQHDINVLYHGSMGFSNIISIEALIGIATDPYNYESKESIPLNYELINGERLKFEDLFKKDTDIYSIVRKVFYRIISSEISNQGDGVLDIYYNYNDKKWQYDVDGYDTIRSYEFVPCLSENEINKIIKSFMSKTEKEFHITDSTLFLISHDEIYSYIDLKDIAKDVVIYDKYITEESLYESSNIGRKGLWTCKEDSNAFYEKYGFAEENLYYHIAVMAGYNFDELCKNAEFKAAAKKKIEDEIESIKPKFEEYKKIARNNPDNFYFFYISIRIQSDYEKDVDFINTKKIEFPDENFLISISTSIELKYTDITYEKNIIDFFLESYRYYNNSHWVYDRSLDNVDVFEDYEGNDVKFNVFESISE